MTLSVSSSEKKYLQQMLDEVSRTFAVVIPFMEAPLDAYMSVAYLIARVVDNIEDCAQPFPWKAERFGEFHRLLHHPEDASEVLAAWEVLNWSGLLPAEREIMSLAGGATLWRIFARIPEASRGLIRDWIGEMAAGMERTLNPEQSPSLLERNGIHILARPQDYNQYCYYVAGTVGNLGTELAHQHYHFKPDNLRTLRMLSETCGRALQKTNIVKDFAKDLHRGICFLPDAWLSEANYQPLRLEGAPKEWKRKVIGDVTDELSHSVEYVLRLPYEALGYRLASLVCLLPAYQVMLLAARRHAHLFTQKHLVKISRLTFMVCLQQARWMGRDNAAVGRYGRKVVAHMARALS